MMGYGSVKSLSQFSAAELTEMGFDLLWIGFEGKRAEFKKMEGRSFAELFADLARPRNQYNRIHDNRIRLSDAGRS